MSSIVPFFFLSSDFRSAIVGHILGYKARLESWLTSVNFQGRLWKPCYSSARDGWDSGIFHQKCDGKGATLTVARANNTIFGGFTDHSWGGMTVKTMLCFTKSKVENVNLSHDLKRTSTIVEN